jgi:hypothetical protein
MWANGKPLRLGRRHHAGSSPVIPIDADNYSYFVVEKHYS